MILTHSDHNYLRCNHTKVPLFFSLSAFSISIIKYNKDRPFDNNYDIIKLLVCSLIMQMNSKLIQIGK